MNRKPSTRNNFNRYLIDIYVTCDAAMRSESGPPAYSLCHTTTADPLTRLGKRSIMHELRYVLTGRDNFDAGRTMARFVFPTTLRYRGY